MFSFFSFFSGTFVILGIVVSTKSSLRETEWVGSKVRGFGEEVLAVSSSTSTLVMVSDQGLSSDMDDGSSYFSTFLNQLPERMFDNIEVVPNVETIVVKEISNLAARRSMYHGAEEDDMPNSPNPSIE